MTTIDFAPMSPARDPDLGSAQPVCLSLVDATDATVVGGKAHALGRMIRAGIAVPEGVVLTARALDSFLSLADTERVSVSADYDIRLPSEVSAALIAHVAPMLAQGAVVVRSSAVGEDGASESFAGQLDSILHVHDIASLERAVIRVWASLWSDRATFYRRARGLPVCGMGVVIQRQVDARTAGVLFTETSSGEMLVEYGHGLADKLVAGEVDPARAAVDRHTGMLSLLDTSIDVVLDDAAAKQLRDTGLALEAEFGGPQDIEWAFDGSGRLFVVQSRPITAVVSIQRAAPTNGSVRRIAWSNANVNENFPRPISPLLYSIASAGYTHYFRNLAVAIGVGSDRVDAMEPAFGRIIGTHGARMYYNLTSIHSVLRLAPLGKAITGSFDAFVGADGEGVETRTPIRRGTVRQLGEATVIALKSTRLLARAERGVQRFEQTVDNFAARSAPARLDLMSLGELGALLAEFVDIRCHKWLGASVADGAAMISYAALEHLLRGAGLGSAAHTSLLKAIPNVVSGEPVLRLWELAESARRDPALVAIFASSDAAGVLRAIRVDRRFSDFCDEFDRYLEEWGFRCSEELMLTSPSFQEDPQPLVELLRAYLGADSTSPRETLRAQAFAREEETRRIVASLGPLRAAVLRILLPRVHAAIRYRERARLKQALLYSRCRRIALAMGSELVRRELIAERDDVFCLTWRELVDLATAGAMLPESTRATVEARKLEHSRLSKVVPPDAFTLPEGASFDVAAVDRQVSPELAATSNALTGTSACAGRVTGRATVLETVTQSGRLARGDVLVTKQTDPGWGPAFFLISGLVIERGGMLSHGAIIAREFGIPCVVGVKDAMRRIVSGTIITVDGDNGVVHVAS